MFKAEEIRPGIWWVGALDWNARLFHGYTTERGITYNAYLIMDEKITLIDTVKAPFADEMLQRIQSVVDPKKIDVVIANHVEMDHSGSLPALKDICKNADFYCSTRAVNEMKAHFGDIIDWHPVKTGDTLNIGSRELSFVETPMVHWPDNMVTYSPADKTLFSNDAFGQHFASSARLEVDSSISEVMKQAQKYYANIVQPYGPQAAAAIKVVKTLDLQMIAPSHGVIWTEYIPQILEAYTRWTSNERVEKAAIIYDSMWGSTEKIARALCQAFMECEIECKFFDVKDTHESDIVAAIMDAKYVCVGSPTLNMKMMPNIAQFLTYFLGLSNKNDNRYGLAFGSYGWAPVGPKAVAAQLSDAKFQELAEPVSYNWVPTTEALDKIEKDAVSAIQKARG